MRAPTLGNGTDGGKRSKAPSRFSWSREPDDCGEDEAAAAEPGDVDPAQLKVEFFLYKTAIVHSTGCFRELIELMNQRLASAVDLHWQVKQSHWNVRGRHFVGLHKLFEKVADETGGFADQIAERIVELGGVAEGTVHAAAERSGIGGYPPGVSDGASYIAAVTCALAAFGYEVRESISEVEMMGDAKTADLLREILCGTDKWVWFVAAHNQGGG